MEEWWKFFGILLLNRLQKQGKMSGLKPLEEKNVRDLLCTHRYSALKTSHNFSDNAIRELEEALRRHLRTVVALGNLGTVDETIIAYTGYDMREAPSAVAVAGENDDTSKCALYVGQVFRELLVAGK